MKKPVSIISVLLIFSVLVSCGPTKHVNATFVLGNWKATKAITFLPYSKEAQEALGPPPLGEEKKAPTSKDAIAAVNIIMTMKRDKDTATHSLAKILDMYPELIREIQFKSDHTARVTQKEQLVEGTWKMSRDGSKVRITSTDKKKIIQLKIKDAGFKDLVLAVPIAEGDFLIDYKK